MTAKHALHNIVQSQNRTFKQGISKRAGAERWTHARVRPPIKNSHTHGDSPAPISTPAPTSCRCSSSPQAPQPISSSGLKAIITAGAAATRRARNRTGTPQQLSPASFLILLFSSSKCASRGRLGKSRGRPGASRKRSWARRNKNDQKAYLRRRSKTPARRPCAL